MVAGGIWSQSIRQWCRAKHLDRFASGVVVSVLRYLDVRRADTEGSTK